MGWFTTSTQKRTRDFFKLVGSCDEVKSPEDMFTLLNETDSTIRDILYRPDSLAGDPFRPRRPIRGKEFVNVSFTRTKIESVDFYDCVFRECLFVRSIIQNCEFHDCQFVDTNTHKIKFKEVYVNPDAFDECLQSTSHQNIGTHLYQRLMNNSNDENQLAFGRSAAFKLNTWKRYQLTYEAKEKWKDSKIEALRLMIGAWGRGFWGWWGAGVRLRRFSLCFTTVILLFSLFNYSQRDAMGLPKVHDFWDAFYFTVITLTTIGYGDITPTETCGKIIMALQGFVGFFLFALTASMIIRRIAP